MTSPATHTDPCQFTNSRFTKHHHLHLNISPHNSSQISPSLGGIRRAQSEGNLESLMISGSNDDDEDDDFSFFSPATPPRQPLAIVEPSAVQTHEFRYSPTLKRTIEGGASESSVGLGQRGRPAKRDSDSMSAAQTEARRRSVSHVNGSGRRGRSVSGPN